MQAYLIRRLLLIIPTLFIVTLIVFLSVHIIPGSVVDLIYMERASVTASGTDQEAGRAQLEHTLGLDAPLHIQYIRWAEGIILRGDLGNSLRNQQPVTDQVLGRFPVTLELTFLSLVVALIIALPIGVYSAIRQDTVGDYIARSFAILCIAAPSFWIGTMVIIYPAVLWGWSPPMSYVPFTRAPLENLQMLIIPAVVLGMVLSGVTMRMTRTMMLEVLRQDYIRTAWSKGLRERTVVIRHALKNAMIPVITVVGLQIPMLMGGAVIIEQIFNLPGIGRLMLDSLFGRDYTMVSAINLLVALIMLVANIVVDLTYAWLDPRVRYT
jgi:peptide/nickel transport system permease protein